MGRKHDPESSYRVTLHKYKGYLYACTQPPITDPETGKRTYHRVHWGTIDENKRFIPGKAYILASPEERSKLIFPDDWDLSAITKLSEKRRSVRHAKEKQDESKLYGDMWFLEQIADVTGVHSDLAAAFHNDAMADAVMTIAFYLLCGKGNDEQLAAWQKTEKTPYDKPLTSSDITDIAQAITEQHRTDFLAHRTSGLGDTKLCAAESLSSPAWGKSHADIRYNKNKEQQLLSPATDVVVYTLKEHIPVYYKTYVSLVPDSGSLKTILSDLEQAGFRNVVLITDKGYESIRNLEACLDNDQPMIMGTKADQKHVFSEIQSSGEFDFSPEDMEIDTDERIYCKQCNIEYHPRNYKKAKQLKLNLYYDPVIRAEELLSLDAEISIQKEALDKIISERIPLDDDVTIKRIYCYYDLVYDKTTRILASYTPDTKKVSEKRQLTGFFANTTYKTDPDPISAYHHYRLRDEQEKYFKTMKVLIGDDRQRNWPANGKTGRSFILFVALILGCYIEYVRKTKLGKQYASVSDILNEMRPVRFVKHPNTKGFITPFTAEQAEICEAFGFDVPKGCAP